jgi:hypothetical protein
MKDRIKHVSWRGTAMTYREYDSGSPAWVCATWTLDFLKGSKHWIVFHEEFLDHHGWETRSFSLYENVHNAMYCFLDECIDDESFHYFN